MTFCGNKLSLKKIISTALFLINCYFLITYNTAQAKSSEMAPIKIGMSTTLSGLSDQLGKQMKLGVEIYFNKINAKGGIQGRKLELITLDDQSNPSKTASNITQLIDKNQVIALIGDVGTPTNLVASQIAKNKKVLLFSPFSGARALRKNPPSRYIMHFRAGYEQETQNIIKGLLSAGFKPEDLAFFTQHDSDGDAAYKGAMQALIAAGYKHPELVPHGSFKANTADVEKGFQTIIAQAKHPIKAFILVGNYESSADFIKTAKKEYPHALYINISYVGSEELAKLLDKDEEGIIVTEVVPTLASTLPAVQDYREDLQSYAKGTQSDFASLEGYLVAKLLVLGLQKAANDHKLSREGIIDTLESMRQIEIGLHLPISFDVTDHQGLETIWPVILKKGLFVPLNWQDLKR